MSAHGIDWAALREVHIPDEIVEKAARVEWYAEENDKVPPGWDTRSWATERAIGRKDRMYTMRYALAAVLADLQALPGPAVTEGIEEEEK